MTETPRNKAPSRKTHPFIYTARDTEGLIAWIDSPELRAAIEDGAERESKVLGVDGEPFTGNIYAVDQILTRHRDNPGRRLVAVERYEVPTEWDDRFGSWPNSRLLRISEHPGMRRVCTWTQKRTSRTGFLMTGTAPQAIGC